ncbi:hypothetical protein TELCIR_08852 [Teladorsagia circumcincta]|uniref:Uncharacterized protein n=1 Tax=Teladorsagia circumcincta TaxID=45464 RepID=A0A2G9UGM7_TELCI|nr:hypothetical protein TELCIR_08852 [Teladorsagia circumcincta]
MYQWFEVSFVLVRIKWTDGERKQIMKNLTQWSMKDGCVNRCYSCASSEYKPIFEKSDMLASSSSVPQFDRFCDIEDSVQAIAPVESCESSCITIFEPQYFGGVFMRHERV